jgi:hypothetical protein
VPLQRVPLTQGAYTAQNVIAAAQRCLNLYPEKNPQGEDSPTTLNLAPGLSRLGVPPEASQVRGLYRSSIGQLFAAVGSGIYYIAPNWTSQLLGTTAVNTTPVKMGDNGTTMTIVDGSAFGWLVDLPTLAYSSARISSRRSIRSSSSISLGRACSIARCPTQRHSIRCTSRTRWVIPIYSRGSRCRIGTPG